MDERKEMCPVCRDLGYVYYVDENGRTYSKPCKCTAVKENRLRNTIMNFRVSPKEKELIEARISATGMEKADFFIQSCLYQTILVRGNIRSFTEIRNRIEELAKTIHRNSRLEEMDPAQAETLKTILEILDRRFEKEETSGGKIV